MLFHCIMVPVDPEEHTVEMFGLLLLRILCKPAKVMHILGLCRNMKDIDCAYDFISIF